MLFITWNEGKNEKVIAWHIGEPMPIIPFKRVMTFQADNDELEMIIDAMKRSRNVSNPSINRT